MAKQPATVVHVRFPPDAYEAMQSLAERRGVTVHAEVVSAVEEHLAKAADPRGSALQTVILAMLEASHGGLGDVLGADWILSQLKVAMDALNAAVGVEEATERTITEARAAKIVTELRSGADTELGRAGRALGLAKPEAGR